MIHYTTASFAFPTILRISRLRPVIKLPTVMFPIARFCRCASAVWWTLKYWHVWRPCWQIPRSGNNDNDDDATNNDKNTKHRIGHITHVNTKDKRWWQRPRSESGRLAPRTAEQLNLPYKLCGVNTREGIYIYVYIYIYIHIHLRIHSNQQGHKHNTHE